MRAREVLDLVTLATVLGVGWMCARLLTGCRTEILRAIGRCEHRLTGYVDELATAAHSLGATAARAGVTVPKPNLAREADEAERRAEAEELGELDPLPGQRAACRRAGCHPAASSRGRGSAG